MEVWLNQIEQKSRVLEELLRVFDTFFFSFFCIVYYQADENEWFPNPYVPKLRGEYTGSQSWDRA